MQKKKQTRKATKSKDPKVRLTQVAEWLSSHIYEYGRLQEKAVSIKDYLRAEGGKHALEGFKADLELSRED